MEETVRKVRTYINKRSNSYTVTSDDIHEYLSKNNIRMNTRQKQSVIAQVLRTPDFEAIDWVPSERVAAKGRLISEWERTY